MTKSMLYFGLMLFSISTFGQIQKIVLYNEKGEKTEKDIFVKKTNFIKGIDSYVEEDSTTRAFRTFVQQTPILFYNENGEEVSKEKFIESTDHKKNIDLFFQGDSLSYALLVTREKVGQLDERTFKKLKNYLSEIGNTQIGTNQNIVINYLSGYYYQNSYNPLRNWNVLDREYLKKLHRIATIKQFWINDPDAVNTDFYHEDRINWIADKDRFFKDLFFPYDVPYGNYILIKPDGKFYYYLGEHSKQSVWKSARKFF